MGFLEVGTPLSWCESAEWLAYVRKHGIVQFIHLYNLVKDRRNDVLKWGDELEYHLIEIPDKSVGPPRLALIAPEVIEILETQDKELEFDIQSAWHPEFGSWMVEATPGEPYGGSVMDLLCVERNMAMRRFRIASVLPPDVHISSVVNFPLLGTGEAFITPHRPAGGPFSYSAYVPDALINPHPRFSALASNIRSRRGRKVNIQMPLYKDVNTKANYITEIIDKRFSRYDLHIPPMEHKEYTDLTAEAALEQLNKWRDPNLPEADRECLAAIFADSCTPLDFEVPQDSLPLSQATPEIMKSLTNPTAVGKPHVPKDGYIHMDAMAFGMGSCCLQVTFQARDMKESRILYDQLAVMAPLLLALSANSPVWRGHLSASDTRWDVISQSVDCRTPFERGDDEPAPSWMKICEKNVENSAGQGKRPISKSRYSSVDAYISDDPELLDEYNDIPLQYDEESYQKLIEAGLDDRLAKHVAHLFIRDPLVIFKERTDTVDDTMSSEHFENIQSTNWRSVRWKPPTVDAAVSGTIGWRVEIRTMESQHTDFENAAYTVFIALLTRVILFFNLRLYIPISLVEENFRRASEKDAIWKQKFWHRRRITPMICCTQAKEKQGGGAESTSASPASDESSDESPWTEMSLADILLGNAEGNFPGLVPLIFAYLDLIECDSASRLVIARYLRLICQRASGKVMTGAAWQRDFIKNHPAYQNDSVVPPEIVRDMLEQIRKLAEGDVVDERLQGNVSNQEQYYKTFKRSLCKGSPLSPEGDEGEEGIHDFVNRKLTSIRIRADNPDMQLPLSPKKYMDDSSDSGDDSTLEDASTHSVHEMDPRGVPESLFPYDHSAVDDSPLSSPISSHTPAPETPTLSVDGGATVASVSSGNTDDSGATGRMRGSSFGEEMTVNTSNECEVLRNLVTYYSSIMGIKKSRAKHKRTGSQQQASGDAGNPSTASATTTSKKSPDNHTGNSGDVASTNVEQVGKDTPSVTDVNTETGPSNSPGTLRQFLGANASLSGGIPSTPDLRGMRGDIGNLGSGKKARAPPKIEELSLN